MRRLLYVALPLLGAAVACSGGGSGYSPGGGTPLLLGDNDPAPPSRDNPGSSRENPSGGEHGPSSSGGMTGCPCAGAYTCSGVSADGGAAVVTITSSGSTCSWTSGGQSIQLGCNGSTTLSGYQYTSSWSGSSIQLCVVVQEAQGPVCISCFPGG